MDCVTTWEAVGDSGLMCMNADGLRELDLEDDVALRGGQYVWNFSDMSDILTSLKIYLDSVVRNSKFSIIDNEVNSAKHV